MTENDRRPAADDADDLNAAEADIYEQERDLAGDDPQLDDDTPAVPDDADPADAHEQQLVVEYDEDDYR